MEEAWKKMDLNGDGKISKEEFTTNAVKEAEDRFGKMDANSDGSVEKEEAEQAGRRLREERERMAGRTGGPGAGPEGNRPRLKE
ncbi:EF-hand domain-containing protein, partial [Verrucomicrobium spinosum]|uniref:EF-hand domain-containing protein n=1 Tax=Verrucomicrobium spinosum TaxID=2736 RepID=UPI00155DABC9